MSALRQDLALLFDIVNLSALSPNRAECFRLETTNKKEMTMPTDNQILIIEVKNDRKYHH